VVNYQVGQEIEVTAGEAVHGGWCIARPAGSPAVFLRHALPGEVVRAEVTEVTSKFARADAIEILKPSPDRVPPPCRYAVPGGCGGCDWQHAALPAQRLLKAAVIAGQLRRLAGIEREVVVEPVPGAADGLGWRTRVRFAVTPDGTAGLRSHRSHAITEVADCLIATPGIRELGIPGLRWQGADSVEAIYGTAEGERALLLSGRRPPRWRHRPR
jgi:tRNA/tmRNA/rRNA uracil-C5-methylase (TrmA/RlmC/RlmD family)